MKYNLKIIYDYFHELQSNKSYFQYFSDIEINTSIINQVPFIQSIAERQIGIMISKYENELNTLAEFYENGRKTTYSKENKNAFQARDDLIYITDNIPIIALMRELPKETFNDLFKQCLISN